MTVEGKVSVPEMQLHLNNFNEGQLLPGLFLECQIVDIMPCPPYSLFTHFKVNIKGNSQEDMFYIDPGMNA